MASSLGLPAIFANMPPPVVFPPIIEHKSTVIIAHGLGDSGNGYGPMVQSWQNNGLFQDTKFILPSAPPIPVTSANGRPIPAWFDIRGERGPHVTFEALTAQPQDEEGLLHSRDYFLSLIQAEINNSSSSSSPSPSAPASTPIPASQIIMGGFSQGGVMALLTGVSAAEAAGVKLGGVFCLSGYLALADAVRKGDVGGGGGGGGRGKGEKGGGKEHDTEVLMVHGDRDPIMSLEWAEDGLGHSINKEVLAKVTAFINKIQGQGREGQHDEL
ncbi:Acyl-protein thioesterase 1 [Cytospora mali]|uniref:Acyl-protein thioesterase 1 n=1 Tax=Cytospora mali TaxID=578113 RepID=A0A194UWU0_CYTMA|nr:Acyl-protein thioesterase 1 [Valsa mali var. pyri (nom. inval.)]